jgi:hypothetical protein
MERTRGNEEKTFSECVEYELGNAMGEMRTFGTSQSHYIQRGFYMDQIERFLTSFERRQLLVLVHEQVRKHPQEAYNKIFAFLGAKPQLIRLEDARVGEYQSTMSARLRAKLHDLFKEHNQRLYKFLGEPIHEWEESSVTTGKDSQPSQTTKRASAGDSISCKSERMEAKLVS